MNKFSELGKYLDKFLQIFKKNKDFNYFYNRGIDFYGRKKYEKAAHYFEQAIGQPEVKPQVYYNLALTYQYMKDCEKAVEAYDKFLEANPDDHDGMYNLALSHFSLKNYSKSSEFYEKCVSIKKDCDSVKSLVLSYMADKQIQKIIDFSTELLEEIEGGLALYYAVAKALESKNSMNKDFTYLDAAIDMYRNLILLNPKHFDALMSVSICYAKHGEWQSSVDYCKKAIEASPDSFEANNQMGLIYYCCNEITEAIKYFEVAIKLKPKGDSKIYSNLAYAYEKVGDKRNAVKIFSQLVKKFPQYPAIEEIKNHLRILKTLDQQAI